MSNPASEYETSGVESSAESEIELPTPSSLATPLPAQISSLERQVYHYKPNVSRHAEAVPTSAECLRLLRRWTCAEPLLRSNPQKDHKDLTWTADDYYNAKSAWGQIGHFFALNGCIDDPSAYDDGSSFRCKIKGRDRRVTIPVRTYVETVHTMEAPSASKNRGQPMMSVRQSIRPMAQILYNYYKALGRDPDPESIPNAYNKTYVGLSGAELYANMPWLALDFLPKAASWMPAPERKVLNAARARVIDLSRQAQEAGNTGTTSRNGAVVEWSSLQRDTSAD